MPTMRKTPRIIWKIGAGFSHKMISAKSPSSVGGGGGWKDGDGESSDRDRKRDNDRNGDKDGNNDSDSDDVICILVCRKSFLCQVLLSGRGRDKRSASLNRSKFEF